MNSKILITFLLILSINYFDKVASQGGVCNFKNYSLYGSTYYGCKLHVMKHHGRQIRGDHETDKTDHDVEYLYDVTLLDLSHFPTTFCEKFSNLKVINFRNNQLQKIEENSLDHCENIEELSLGVNRIKSLPKSIFNNKTTLKNLWLHKNQIEELSDGIFDSLINIELLSMSHNKLKKLNPKLFKNLANLKNLFLDENQLVELPARIFSPLVSLEKLWLDGNKLTTFHFASFGKLPKLHNFNFNSTHLNLFDEKIIANLPQLLTVDARSNPCVSVDKEITDHTPSSIYVRLALKTCFENYRETLDGRVGQLEDEKIKMNTLIEVMRNEKEQMSENISHLRNDSEEIKGHFEKIVKVIETQVTYLKSEDIITIDEIKKLRSANEELKAKIEVLSAANDDIQNKLQAKFDSQIEAFKNQINDDIKNLKEDNEKLKAENEEINKIIGML